MADLNDENEGLADDEIKAEFALLFPHGWAGSDVLTELAPRGWAESPLVAIYHPSVAQMYDESVRMRRNLAGFRRTPDDIPPKPEPTLEEVTAQHEETQAEPERECQELVGLCLWDIFSDNHEVIATDGRKVDLGSMRSSGGFLAEVLNAQGGPPPAPRPEPPAELMASMFPPADSLDPATAALVERMKKEMFGDGGYTYLDFYMGTGAISGRADLRPVYEMIFRRLHGRGMDWEYHFPRIGLVDMRQHKKQLDEQKRGDDQEWAGYDPSSAFEEAQEDQKRDEEIAEMRESLDEGYRESVELAQVKEPPATVQAYKAVYGQFPNGWPPVAEE
jgi:hypothetical protein